MNPFGAGRRYFAEPTLQGKSEILQGSQNQDSCKINKNTYQGPENVISAGIPNDQRDTHMRAYRDGLRTDTPRTARLQRRDFGAIIPFCSMNHSLIRSRCPILRSVLQPLSHTSFGCGPKVVRRRRALNEHTTGLPTRLGSGREKLQTETIRII